MVKRRYSEFESLRNLLCKIHKSLIIPPIPEKQSLTDYAGGAGKAKEDLPLIERRKRTLQRFLNRILNHPVLGSDIRFIKFLQNVSWVKITK